jgi:hypothetical protein
MGNAGHAGASSDTLAEMMRGAYRSPIEAFGIALGPPGTLRFETMPSTPRAQAWRKTNRAIATRSSLRFGEGGMLPEARHEKGAMDQGADKARNRDRR